MSRYTEAHANPQGPGDARPTALQIVKDEGLVGELNDKIFVITGVSSGIGIETVRALAATGATLFLTARNVAKAETALAGILDPSRMSIVEMDNECLDSVRSAAKSILSKTDKVNVLVNNAGVMNVQALELTKNGFERQFATNHLAHFLFFQHLKPALLAAATPEFPSRVVNVSSGAHRAQGLNDSDDYNFKKGNYSPMGAYGQSKTAKIYMANEIERRYGPLGLHATSLHPGVISTALSRHMPETDVKAIFSTEGFGPMMKNTEQGAATTVWAAIGKEWASRGGKYLSDCAETTEGDASLHTNPSIHAPWAYHAEKEARLWRDSLRLVGLDADE